LALSRLKKFAAFFRGRLSHEGSPQQCLVAGFLINCLVLPFLFIGLPLFSPSCRNSFRFQWPEEQKRGTAIRPAGPVPDDGQAPHV
jgi:hypothetical protein